MYLIVDYATHTPRLLCALRILKASFGNNSIFLYKVNKHVPLSPILGGRNKKMTHKTSLIRLPPTSTVDVGIQIVVTTFQLQ